MSKTEFIKWLLELKEEVARELVEGATDGKFYDQNGITWLGVQNDMLADIINAAQDVNNLD